jgi:deazaflavin-dependent oxidoreductase (nitroreductase family)
MSPSLISKPPAGLLRWAFRAPIPLYRLGLGWLLGNRFLLLNHIGRKSGQLHQTVVEVVAHDKQTDTYYIVSGWGYKANWYKNLIAIPAITIQVGRRALAVRAETISPTAGVQVLLDYRHQHPLAARELSRLLEIDIHSSDVEKLEGIVREKLPVIALRPQSDNNPVA